MDLKSMDPVMMKFKIHVDLKQYDKAVQKLAKGDKILGETHPELREQYFEEALQLIKKNRLFKQAFEDYSHSESLTKKIKFAFGEYLHMRGYSEEASFVYSAAGDVELALTSFKKSLNVEMCMALAAQGSFSQSQRAELIEELIERLKNSNRYEVSFVQVFTPQPNIASRRTYMLAKRLQG